MLGRRGADLKKLSIVSPCSIRVHTYATEQPKSFKRGCPQLCAPPRDRTSRRSCRAADRDGSVVGVPPLDVPEATRNAKVANPDEPTAGQEQATHVGSHEGVRTPPPHPVLCKIAEGVKLIANTNSTSTGALSDSSVTLHGAHGCCAHLDYDAASGGILVNFVCDDTSKRAFQLDEASQGDKVAWVKPEWALNDKVKVHGMLNEMLASLLHPADGAGQPTLMQAGVYLSEVCAEMPPGTRCTAPHAVQLMSDAACNLCLTP